MYTYFCLSHYSVSVDTKRVGEVIKFVRRYFWLLIYIFLSCLLFLPTSQSTAQSNPALPSDLSYSTETTWHLPTLPNLSATAGYLPHNFSQTAYIYTYNQQIIHGFKAHKNYQAIDLHSLIWAIETAQYYYPEPYLRETLEAQLKQQIIIGQDQGTLPDVVSSNDVLYLIHGAYQYYNVNYNTQWLQQKIDGTQIITRLNWAGNWIYTHRLAPDSQLIQSNTSNSATVFLDHPMVWTHSPDQPSPSVSIYDQALAYLTFIELATLNAAVGATDQADLWQTRAETLKVQTNSKLWNSQNGYFNWKYNSDEDKYVTIANSLAVYSGLTSSSQNKTIFDQLEWTRLEAKAKKPGVSVYPYFPASESSSALFTPGQGYNGGVWDWWAGIQIKAEFLNGFAELGQQHLIQLANDWQTHPGNIISWQPTNLNSDQEGHHFHTAAAGTTGNAIIEGFFGVSLSGRGLTLQPRLGLTDGFIRVYQPATDRYAAYSYDWNQTITHLNYGTNAQDPVQIKILILPTDTIHTVLLDEKSIPYTLTTMGHDTYLEFVAPNGEHQVQILKGQRPTTEITDEVAISETQTIFSVDASGFAPNFAPRQNDTSNELPMVPSGNPIQPIWYDYLQRATMGWIIFTSSFLIILTIFRRLWGYLRQNNRKDRKSPI